jgi:hypothetical protein
VPPGGQNSAAVDMSGCEHVERAAHGNQIWAALALADIHRRSAPIGGYLKSFWDKRWWRGGFAL